MSVLPARPSLRHLTRLTVLLVTLLPGSGAGADRTPAREIEALRDRVLEDPSLQTDLPGWEAHEGTRSSKSRRSRPRRTWWLPDRPAAFAVTSVGSLLQLGLLALGAVALVTGLVWLTRELLTRRRRPSPRRSSPRRTAAGDAPAEPEDFEGMPPEGDLETLVGQGEYGAAIHLLLLKALDRLSGRGPHFPAGRTSREVLSASTDLTPPAHGALGELVAAVERCLFGGHEPGREDFDRCRQAFGVVDRALSDTPGEEPP